MIDQIINLTTQICSFSKKNVLYIAFDESEYTKVESSVCISRQGYPTLHGAKVACSMETSCMGVLDEKCGNTTNSYFVCSNDLEKGVNIDACVHKKTTSKGMWYLLYVQIVATKK